MACGVGFIGTLAILVAVVPGCCGCKVFNVKIQPSLEETYSVPLDIYFARGYAKLTLGVARGRKLPLWATSKYMVRIPVMQLVRSNSSPPMADSLHYVAGPMDRSSWQNPCTWKETAVGFPR